MKSFKQMIKDGDIKRADAMKVRIEDIHEEPGFNLRREGEDLTASIDALAAHIVSGGIVPPMEVRPREEGGVFVVDGHRRRRAYLQVADQVRDGSGELWLSVVAFVGNDADRVARIITSAEGRALSPLEVAEGYKRLIAYSWTPEQIAQKVGKTRQHVDQALILANANSDVQALVAGGGVSATSAIDAVRKHGEDAGKVLGGAVDAARAAGKSKATSGAIKGKPLPRKLVSEVEETLIRFADTYSAKDERPDAVVVADLLEIIADIRECRKRQAERGQAKAVKDAQTDIEVPA
jgi:ParB family transcriptional regulator, chromosome partitioning protein